MEKIDLKKYCKIHFPTGSHVEDYYNDNMDVNIVLDNGKVYFVTMFTIENVRTLLKGDYFSNSYFWAADMVIINDLKIDTIIKAVTDLIENQDLTYGNYFKMIGDEKEIFGDPPEFNEVIDLEY